MGMGGEGGEPEGKKRGAELEGENKRGGGVDRWRGWKGEGLLYHTGGVGGGGGAVQ
jgi:hypothetical protein